MTWDNKQFGGSRVVRRDQGRKHAPLRTFTELCEEFGETASAMAGLIARHAGPKPVVIARGTSRNCYYDPQGFRTWYASLRRGKQ